MRFSCLQENLSKGLNTINRIIPLRASLPILSNVLLKTEKGRLKLSGTNLEIGINYWLGAKIEKEGEITVPARTFSEYIGSLPEGKINLSTKDTQLLIKIENYEAKIFGTDTSEFPLIPEIKGKELISIEFKKLLEAIPQVIFAVAQDESRPILSGIYCNFREDQLTMVATDSYRLSEKIIKLPQKIKEEFSVIVPAKTINELAYILNEENESPEVAVAENQILFRFKNVELISKLIEGDFPNYKQIIPESYETRVIFNTEELIKVIRLANIFAREGTGSVKLQINPPDKVIVGTSIASLGDNTSIVKAKIEGASSEINFNNKYLLDVLTNLKSPEVSLELNGKLNPGVLRPLDGKDYLHIIMPLRV